MLRRIILGTAVLLGSAGQTRKNADPLLKGILEAGKAIKPIIPHLDAVKELTETADELKNEAGQRFKGGSYTGEEAATLLQDMGEFLKIAKEKMDPLAEKVQKTAMTDQQIKSATHRINAALAPLEKILKDEEKISAVKLESIKHEQRVAKKLPLEKRIKLHMDAQQDYLSSLKEFITAKSNGDLKAGFQLLLKTGRCAEQVEATKLLPSERTDEIKTLQTQIDPLVKQLRQEFKNSQKPAPKATQNDEIPQHEGLRRRM